jgi:hypothetical protein
VSARTSDELVFIPNVGFRLARGAMDAANVVVEQAGRTLTAGLTSDRDGAEIRMTVAGLDETLEFRQSRRVEAPVRITDDRGRVLDERPGHYEVNSNLYRLMEGPTMFQRVVSLDRLESDVRGVEIVMEGAAGDWRVTIPVEPRTAAGPHGMPTDAIDIHHGIAISAPLIARTPELTAIELQAYLVDPDEGQPKTGRIIEGISSLTFGRGLGTDLLIVRDSVGTHHLERPHQVQDRIGRGRRREVALFEPMAPGANSASLEIPYVAVREISDETVLVPVPSETDVTMAGCRAHVVTSRVSRSSDSTLERPSPVEGLNGPCIRIVITPDDPDAERQLVTCGVMESNDRGMSLSIGRSGPPIIEVPDPFGDGAHVTLRGPVIRVRGPWKLDIPLPAVIAEA